MKKVFFVLLILAFVVVLFFNKDKIFNSNNKYEDLGYSSVSAKKIKELKIDAFIGEKYSKTLDKVLESNKYVNDYLQDYIKINYIDNESFVNGINNLLKDGMTSDEINNISFLFESKYYKNELLNDYIEYYKKHNNYKDNIVIYTNIGLNKDFYTNISEISDPDNILILINKYNKLPDNYEPKDVVDLNTKYKISSSERKLRKVAADAFMEMSDAAKKEGCTLQLNSGFRTKSYQNSLFTNSTNKNGLTHALAYSAKARHSEHETGLAADINFCYESFDQTKEYTWLTANAYKYGFIERYPKGKEFITGYGYEPWHYRYVGKEVAKVIKEENITFEEYAVMYLGYLPSYVK